jgi:acyl carrier protein
MRPQGDRAPTGGRARHSAAVESTPSKKRFCEFSEGDFSVDVEQILDIVHQTAAEMMAAKNGEVAAHGSAVSAEGADSLIDRYGFSSIDALECLLILEQKFGITLADEDLNDEVLSSASALAKHIAALRQTQDSDSCQ